MDDPASSTDTFHFLSDVRRFGIKKAISLAAKRQRKYLPALRALRAKMRERGKSYTKRSTKRKRAARFI